MKLNKKGFMMAEVVVVSAIVLITITGLYVSYGKIYSIYNTRVNYYDTDVLYRLGYYRDVLIENENGNSQKLINQYLGNNSEVQNISLTTDLVIPSDENELIYLIKNPNQNLNVDKIKGVYSNINETFIDYIEFLDSSLVDTEIKASHLMIIESCEKENENNCKYAYLEVYNEQ